MRSINIRFPFLDDREKNKLVRMNNVTKDRLSSNLMLLLLTDKGERYYMPNYGTNLRKFIFEPKDDITVGDIEEDLRNTVKEFIPELTITSVNIYTIEDEDGQALGETDVRFVIKFSYDEGIFQESGAVEIIF